MEKILTTYNIDSWYIKLPQDWRFSLDKSQQPPQIIFDTEDELVNVYISTWNWERPQNSEKASADDVASFFVTACESQGYEMTDSFAEYYPEGFNTYTAQGVTDDNYLMLAFGICTEGQMLSIYFVGEQGVDLTSYIGCIKTVELD